LPVNTMHLVHNLLSAISIDSKMHPL